MATKKYLDKDGLQHFWGKLKSWVTSRGYITSSGSITGNAATATKLKTARAISAGDLEFQGSASFDGSGDVKLNVTNHRCIVSVSNTNNYPFHRIAYISTQTGNYVDRGITFLVNKDFHGGGWGICRIIFRTNNVANGQTADCNVQWLVRSEEISADSIQVGFVKTAGASYLDVFYKSSGTYNSAICRVLACSNTRNGVGRGFTVVSASTEVNGTTATDPKTSVESYKTIADAGTALHNQAYTDIIAASDVGVTGKLATARKIFGLSFDGSADIGTYLSRIRSIEFTDIPSNAGYGGVIDFHYNGSTSDYTSRIIEVASGVLHINGVTINTDKVVSATSFSGELSGNAGTATKLKDARTISLTGDVSGSASFDGSANASITATVADDSHNHVISNVDGLQTALDGKAADSGVVHLAGAEMITGAKTFSSEVNISTANALRMKSSSYGAFFRNDNSSFYLLVTASGDADGTWTTARPLTVNLATGVCSINGNAATATGDADGNAIKTTYAKLASPSLTGTPTAPTAAAGTNTTQIATTAFVNTKCGNYVAKSGDTMTGNLEVRARNVDLSTTSTSQRETWPYQIARNTADTTHNGYLMRIGAMQSANTKDYSLQIAVGNPRGGNLPTSATISAGTDDSDASTGNCWGGIGVWYDYSKNRVYPVTQGTSAYAVTDNNTTHLATTNWVRTATGNFACNAATATKLAGPKHSYTVAKSAAKNWYRIANANVSQTEATNTLHVQFMVTAYNSGQDTGYYERWFVDCEVFGRNAGIRIFGNTNAPFSQARVLYENTIADIDGNDRPAIDLYLNYVMSNAATTVVVEELYNSGWTFVADGTLAASTVPSGFENRAIGVNASGVERSTFADYVPYLNRQISNITAAFTLADTSTYRSHTLNCTGTFTITVPSINSGYMWCVIKNKNTSSGVITLHPSTTSVLIDGSNADITLQPMEYVCIHSAGANNYSLIADGRWKSQSAQGLNVTNLGENYQMNSTSFAGAACKFFSVATFKSGTTSVPYSGDVGDYSLLRLYGGADHFAQFLMASPRDRFLWYGSFWDGAFDRWIRVFSDNDHIRLVGGNTIFRAVDNDALYLSGGTDIAISAHLKLTGKDYTGTTGGGAFDLIALTSSSNAKHLYGAPSGTLQWNGQNIQTTSDQRLKTRLENIPDEVLDAWEGVEWGQFQYLEAVEEKGKSARLHSGLVSQQVQMAFSDRGLDACDYGLICHETKAEVDEDVVVKVRDAYTDAEGAFHPEEKVTEHRHEDAVDLWMIRYAEALCMEAAYQRRRADRLEARIAALEEAMNG